MLMIFYMLELLDYREIMLYELYLIVMILFEIIVENNSGFLLFI